MQPYIACLKKNGIDLPNGGFFGGRNRNGQGGQNAQGEGSAPPSLQLGGAPQTQAQGQSGGNGAPASPPPSFDRSKFQAAQQACASLLPEGATFGPFGGGQGGGANASAFNAYRSCMSDHGVTLPSRQNGQSASSSSPPVSIDRNSDAFKAANTVCAPLLPNGGQGFGGQGGPNGQSGANGQGNGGQTGQGGTTQGTNP